MLLVWVDEGSLTRDDQPPEDDSPMIGFSPLTGNREKTTADHLPSPLSRVADLESTTTNFIQSPSATTKNHQLATYHENHNDQHHRPYAIKLF